MQEIAENVYWLPSSYVNIYLCRDEDGWTLIDTGTASGSTIVWNALQSLKLQPADIVRIIITHADIDHAGSAAAIQKLSGAMVYASAETAEYLTTGKSPKHMPALVQFFVSRFIRYEAVSPQAITIVRDGDTLPACGGLQAVATPGHTPDHFSFYSPAKGILFAGDALNTRKDRLNRTPPNITADETAANQSAIRLLELAPAIIACGHGEPLTHHDSDQIMRLFNELRAA
jgi:glyoxylase-like metal-dependent hydrolase (beta-lactamase superfamily II)